MSNLNFNTLQELKKYMTSKEYLNTFPVPDKFNRFEEVMTSIEENSKDRCVGIFVKVLREKELDHESDFRFTHFAYDKITHKLISFAFTFLETAYGECLEADDFERVEGGDGISVFKFTSGGTVTITLETNNAR